MATIRRPGVASATVLIGLSVSMAAAHLLAPEWSSRVGLDVWNYAEMAEQKRSATEERAEMDAKAERNARRRAAADQLASRLVTRDADLATVAVELTELFSDDIGSRCALEAYCPHVTDPRLLYARHAIHRVSRLLVHDPDQSRTVCDRLEADYGALIATWGAVASR